MSTTTFSNMCRVLIIDNLQIQDGDIIREYFATYNIAKLNDIVFHSHFGHDGNGYAIIYIDYWCSNLTAENMYDRIVERGDVRMVYDDPKYFVVRFYGGAFESDGFLGSTDDYRYDYVEAENKVDETPDYREDYVEAENRVVNNDDDDDDVKLECERDAVYDGSIKKITGKLDELVNRFNQFEVQLSDVNRTQLRMKKMRGSKRVLPEISKTVYKKTSTSIKSANVWARRLRISTSAP